MLHSVFTLQSFPPFCKHTFLLFSQFTGGVNGDVHPEVWSQCAHGTVAHEDHGPHCGHDETYVVGILLVDHQYVPWKSGSVLHLWKAIHAYCYDHASLHFADPSFHELVPSQIHHPGCHAANNVSYLCRSCSWMLTPWKWVVLPTCQQQAAYIFRVMKRLGYMGRLFVRPKGEGKKQGSGLFTEDGGSMFLWYVCNTGHFQMVPTHKNSVNINTAPLWKPTT